MLTSYGLRLSPARVDGACRPGGARPPARCSTPRRSASRPMARPRSSPDQATITLGVQTTAPVAAQARWRRTPRGWPRSRPRCARRLAGQGHPDLEPQPRAPSTPIRQRAAQADRLPGLQRGHNHGRGPGQARAGRRRGHGGRCEPGERDQFQPEGPDRGRGPGARWPRSRRCAPRRSSTPRPPAIAWCGWSACPRGRPMAGPGPWRRR